MKYFYHHGVFSSLRFLCQGAPFAFMKWSLPGVQSFTGVYFPFKSQSQAERRQSRTISWSCTAGSHNFGTLFYLQHWIGTISISVSYDFVFANIRYRDIISIFRTRHVKVQLPQYDMQTWHNTGHTSLSHCSFGNHEGSICWKNHSDPLCPPCIVHWPSLVSEQIPVILRVPLMACTVFPRDLLFTSHTVLMLEQG